MDLPTSRNSPDSENTGNPTYVTLTQEDTNSAEPGSSTASTASTSSGTSSFRNKPRHRAQHACVQCHEAKRKCDKVGRPNDGLPCSRCIKLGHGPICVVFGPSEAAPDGVSLEEYKMHLRRVLKRLAVTLCVEWGWYDWAKQIARMDPNTLAVLLMANATIGGDNQPPPFHSADSSPQSEEPFGGPSSAGHVQGGASYGRHEANIPGFHASNSEAIRSLLRTAWTGPGPEAYNHAASSYHSALVSTGGVVAPPPSQPEELEWDLINLEG